MKYFSILILYFFGCTHNGDDLKDSIQVPDHLVGIDHLIVHESNQDPLYSIHFEKELEFTNTDEHWIGSMSSFDVDSDNSIYIVSGHEIHVIDSTGSYHTTLGGTGDGPGEFRAWSLMKPIVQSNHLYMYDGSLQRINVYSLEPLEFVDTIMLSPDNWDQDLRQEMASVVPLHHDQYIRNDQTMLAGFRLSDSVDDSDENSNVGYYLLDMEGNIISDRLFTRKNANLFSGVGISGPMLSSEPELPFKQISLVAVSDDGHFYSAWSEEFLINAYSPDGSYKHAFYHPFNQSTLNPDDVIQHSYSTYTDNSEPPPAITRALRQVDYPDTWPALAHMLIDNENRLWIATITDDEDNYEWWVVDEPGELLAKFKWPGRRLHRHLEQREIHVIKNGYLFTRETDEMGEASIVRYRIEMEESE